eukprot:2344713-Rhodomonas_salina.1
MRHGTSSEYRFAVTVSGGAPSVCASAKAVHKKSLCMARAAASASAVSTPAFKTWSNSSSVQSAAC